MNKSCRNNRSSNDKKIFISKDDYKNLELLCEDGLKTDWIYFKGLFSTGYSWKRLLNKILSDRIVKRLHKKKLEERRNKIPHSKIQYRESEENKPFGYMIKPDLSFLNE